MRDIVEGDEGESSLVSGLWLPIRAIVALVGGAILLVLALVVAPFTINADSSERAAFLLLEDRDEQLARGLWWLAYAGCMLIAIALVLLGGAWLLSKVVQLV